MSFKAKSPQNSPRRARWHRVCYILGLLLMVGIFGFSAYRMIQITSSPENVNLTGLLTFLTYMLGGGTICALLFWRLVWPKIVDSGLDFLLYPRSHLKTPPPLLSPIRGAIARGELNQARTALEKFLVQHPESGAINLLYCELTGKYLQDETAAITQAQRFLATGSSAPERRQIVQLLLELYRNQHQEALIRPLLTKELQKRSFYLPADRRNLQKILNYLPEEPFHEH